MRDVLFISTKESYMPNSNITGAGFIPEKGMAVVLEHSGAGAGNLLVSSQEEANWFIKAIHANKDCKESLIIDYLERKVYETQYLESEFQLPIKSTEETKAKETTSPIQGLELES